MAKVKRDPFGPEWEASYNDAMAAKARRTPPRMMPQHPGGLSLISGTGGLSPRPLTDEEVMAIDPNWRPPRRRLRRWFRSLRKLRVARDDAHLRQL